MLAANDSVGVAVPRRQERSQPRRAVSFQCFVFLCVCRPGCTETPLDLCPEICVIFFVMGGFVLFFSLQPFSSLGEIKQPCFDHHGGDVPRVPCC